MVLLKKYDISTQSALRPQRIPWRVSRWARWPAQKYEVQRRDRGARREEPL